METALLDDYAEPDFRLGFNVAGVILRVVGQPFAACPGGGGNDSIQVCLHRREDDLPVGVEIPVVRSRRQGQECVLLSRVAEQPEEEGNQAYHE